MPRSAPRPQPSTARAYTPGDLALRNLSARIDGLRAVVRRHPARREDRGALVGALLQRATFTGSVADYDEVLALSSLSAELGADPDRRHARRTGRAGPAASAGARLAPPFR